jgi:hypothetical protein
VTAPRNRRPSCAARDCGRRCATPAGAIHMPAELSPVLSPEWEKRVAHATGCVYRSSLATPREVISKIAPAEESGSPIMLRRRAAHRACDSEVPTRAESPLGGPSSSRVRWRTYKEALASYLLVGVLSGAHFAVFDSGLISKGRDAKCAWPNKDRSHGELFRLRPEIRGFQFSRNKTESVTSRSTGHRIEAFVASS